ncbi:diguanylate cyclase, partial [bacterium]|nr:diguanylate cyclase [bacterium]
GILHIPESIRQKEGWWPFEGDEPAEGLFVFNPSEPTNWQMKRAPFSPRCALGREMWGFWETPFGVLVVLAQRTPGHSYVFNLQHTWNFRIAWHSRHVVTAAENFLALLKSYPEVYDVVNQLRYPPEMQQDRRGIGYPMQSVIQFADSYDPWVQRQLQELLWVRMQNSLQKALSGELRSERLMPAVGHALRRMFKYDMFEIHIFSRLGSRYEEFISWRRNFTGVGDNRMSLLLNEKFVSEVLEDHRPRIIDPRSHKGIMNRHLAEIAELKEGLVVPLTNAGRVEGMMMLYFKNATGVSHRQFDKLSQLGRLVGQAIEVSNAHSRVHKMATMDPLTNISNRRFFARQIQTELSRARRYGHSLALIMIDIDNFKHYNDNHGHLQGDQLLKMFANVLRASVRAEDIVSRYGGEEFAVVLPETDAKAGRIVAEKIRTSVYETDFPFGEQQPLGRLTISLGVSDDSYHVKSSQDLINHADQALYRAKEEGRNRTVVYQPELDSVA